MVEVRDFSPLWIGNTSENKCFVFSVLLITMSFLAGIRHEGERISSPERGRKRTSDLDFTKVCWRRTIRAFTMLCYFRRTYGSRWPVEVSGATSLVLFFSFSFCEKNKDVYKRERRVQLSREPVSHPHSLIDESGV